MVLILLASQLCETLWVASCSSRHSPLWLPRHHTWAVFSSVPPPPPPPSRIHSLPALSPWPVPPWLPCPLTSGWVGQGERGTSRLGSGRRGGQAFVTPAPSLSSCSSGGGCIPEVTAPTHTGLQHHSPSLTHQAQGC